MKFNIKKTLLVFGFVSFMAANVFAADLASLKAQGIIGEMPNGLVGSVTTVVDPSVKAVMDNINAERLKKYQQIAAGNGLALSKVQALAGEKLINQTEPGQYVQTASGSWIKK